MAVHQYFRSINLKKYNLPINLVRFTLSGPTGGKSKKAHIAKRTSLSTKPCGTSQRTLEYMQMIYRSHEQT